jgi:hypothetical protein
VARAGRKEVRYCDRIDEAYAVAVRGGCVAVDLRVPRRPGDLTPFGRNMLTGVLAADSTAPNNIVPRKPPE